MSNFFWCAVFDENWRSGFSNCYLWNKFWDSEETKVYAVLLFVQILMQLVRDTALLYTKDSTFVTLKKDSIEKNVKYFPIADKFEEKKIL